jgi:mannose-6-phosphate isomerase-like protein (cupin superfamily)
MTRAPEPTSKATASHYVWAADCDGWRLVDGNDLSVIHERMPPGRQEVRHVHGRARQFFFVLTGALMLEVEGERHVLRAGTGLEIAPGLAHQAINDGPDAVEFLVISQPTTRGDRKPAPA